MIFDIWAMMQICIYSDTMWCLGYIILLLHCYIYQLFICISVVGLLVCMYVYVYFLQQSLPYMLIYILISFTACVCVCVCVCTCILCEYDASGTQCHNMHTYPCISICTILSYTNIIYRWRVLVLEIAQWVNLRRMLTHCTHACMHVCSV